MSGENVTLLYAGQNGTETYHIKAARIEYGMTLITEEDEASQTKALYTRQVQQNEFSVTSMHSSRTERDAFFAWCEQYGRWVTSTFNGQLGIARMRVQGPRGFDFYGVLSKGFVLATAVKDVTWHMTLQFVGAWPANNPNFYSVSKFTIGADPNNAYYYPAGIQLAGGQSAQDQLYSDPSLNVPLNPDGNPRLTTPIKGPF